MCAMTFKFVCNSAKPNEKYDFIGKKKFRRKTYLPNAFHWATHCEGVLSHCNTLQHIATHCNTHCNTLQHTATHCNTLRRSTVTHVKESYQHVLFCPKCIGLSRVLDKTERVDIILSHVWQYSFAVCCSVLQCVAVWQYSFAVCCSVLQCVAVWQYSFAVCCSVLQCVAVWQYSFAVCCSVLQCVAVWQYSFAVCCSVF